MQPLQRGDSGDVAIEYQTLFFNAIKVADGLGKTDLTGNAKLVRAGVSAGAEQPTANTITHIARGLYKVVLDEAERDVLGYGRIQFDDATIFPVSEPFFIYPYDPASEGATAYGYGPSQWMRIMLALAAFKNVGRGPLGTGPHTVTVHDPDTDEIIATFTVDDTGNMNNPILPAPE